MIRYFYLENWKSFQESAVLDLVATREQRDGQTLTKIKTPSSRILPVAAMYGANAAGKSSVVQALGALREIVVQDRTDSAKLPIVPSRLNPSDRPTTLEIEFVVSAFKGDSQGEEGSTPSGTWEDHTYRYMLSATRHRIVEETLTRVRATTEQEIFTRKGDEPASLSDRLRGSIWIEQYAATAEGNETILRRLAKRDLPDVDELKSVFNWFEQVLNVLGPGGISRQLPGRLRADQLYRETMTKDLTTADTGIRDIRFRPISVSDAPFVEDILRDLVEELRDHGGLFVLSGDNGQLILLSLKDDKPFAEELVTIHEGASADATFDLTLDQESDGTIRYFNLLPMLHDLSASGNQNVYVVDEIDRSIHPGLIAQIIEHFLERCAEGNRSQLIFTTHAASLLRLGVFRRDEVWFVEKARDDDGRSKGSELIRLSDLSHWGIRDNTDLFNRYLSGTLPGSPRRSYV